MTIQRGKTKAIEIKRARRGDEATIQWANAGERRRRSRRSWRRRRKRVRSRRALPMKS